MALLCVFGRYNFGNLLPIVVVKILNELGILNHEGKESILEEVRLIILPLSQRAQRLSRILLLFEEFIEYFHGLLIRNDAFAVELVLTVFEPDNVLQVITARAGSSSILASFGLLPLSGQLRTRYILVQSNVLLSLLGSNKILLEAIDIHQDIIVLVNDIAVDVAALVDHHIVVGQLEMDLLLSLVLADVILLLIHYLLVGLNKVPSFLIVSGTTSQIVIEN